MEEASICVECQHTYVSCVCKSCSKCGTTFLKYFRTKFIKGRSHCRVCRCPVCIVCVINVKGYEKVCTRCQLKKKEAEVSAEQALSAVSEAKYGINIAQTAVMTNPKSEADTKENLFAAAKKGLDHILITLISSGGCEVDCRDENFNTPLHYASQGGFIASVALLLEKGADVGAKNNQGWTALHFVASSGSTEAHMECAKFLLDMDVDVMAESSNGETAADLAQRCAVRLELVQLLKAIEVEVAMEEVSNRSRHMVETSVDVEERRYGRMLATLINFISMLTDCESNSNKSCSNHLSSFMSDGSGDGKLESTDSEDLDGVLVERCSNLVPAGKHHAVEKELFKNVRTFVDRAVSPIQDELHELMKDTKVNDELENLLVEKREWEERCQALMTTIDESSRCRDTSMAEKKCWEEKYSELMKESVAFRSDFQKAMSEKREWEQRCSELMEEISTSTHQYEKTHQERKEWENRCRNLMNSVANSTKQHKRQIQQMEDEHEAYRAAKEEEYIDYKAECTNKANKQKQEYESKIAELQEELEECKSSRCELLQFQRKMKLTWIPDEAVGACQEVSCRSVFTTLNRKHHCRYCGRVYCLKCSQKKVDLPHLGYNGPVRVCDSCYHVHTDSADALPPTPS